MWWLLIVALAAVAGMGFFAGKYYTDKIHAYDIDQISVTIDSLAAENTLLQDSIRGINRDISETVTTRIKYQTVYDTIQVVTVPSEILSRMDAILSTPPQ